jgi:phosphoribosyl 1,2-cyclic phosphodiesterase
MQQRVVPPRVSTSTAATPETTPAFPTTPEGFNVVFLGTGVSTGIPCLSHVINGTDTDGSPCATCLEAYHNRVSKSRRNNVSVGILFRDDHGEKCVLIDVGKTMREACMARFPPLGIREVHGILLTHDHADAILGLDDVRDLQRCEQVKVTTEMGIVTGFRPISGPLPVYLTEKTMEVVKQAFGYLTRKPKYLDEPNNILERRVACLDFRLIDSNAGFNVAGLPVRSFPVYHGGTYVSLGFSIGRAGEFVYISDVKIIPDDTWLYLESLPRIKVFVIDALDEDGIFSHMGLHEALAVVARLQPEVAYFVGMTCSIGSHEAAEARLRELAPNAHYAFDGLVLAGFSLV